MRVRRLNRITKDIFVCVLTIIGTKAMVRTMKRELQEIQKKTEFLDLLCQQHSEKFFGTGKWLFGRMVQLCLRRNCQNLFYGTPCRNKSCFQAHSLNGLLIEQTCVPMSYPGPARRWRPSRTLWRTPHRVAQDCGPLVILLPPLVCKLWRLIGKT